MNTRNVNVTEMDTFSAVKHTVRDGTRQRPTAARARARGRNVGALQHGGEGEA